MKQAIHLARVFNENHSSQWFMGLEDMIASQHVPYWADDVPSHAAGYRIGSQDMPLSLYEVGKRRTYCAVWLSFEAMAARLHSIGPYYPWQA